MNKLQYFTYTKDNGDVSDRVGIVVAPARENALMYDVSKLTDRQTRTLVQVLENIETFKAEEFADFEATTQVKLNSLYRSFKPLGISWDE